MDLDGDNITETAVDYYCKSNSVSVKEKEFSMNARVVAGSSGDWSLGVGKRNCQTYYGTNCVSGKCACEEGNTNNCGVSNLGVCAFGFQFCENGTWGECVGAVYPSVEVCYDTLDNDCDGLVDENCGGGDSVHALRIISQSQEAETASIGETLSFQATIQNYGNIPVWLNYRTFSHHVAVGSSSSGSGGGGAIEPPIYLDYHFGNNTHTFFLRIILFTVLGPTLLDMDILDLVELIM